jgi:hypothetical protein
MHKAVSFSLLLFTLASCSPSTKPVVPIVSDPENRIELMVFTGYLPIRAAIPEIHIWRSGRAIWWSYNEVSHRYEFFETILSDAEAEGLDNILFNAGYWQDESRGHKHMGSSQSTIWTSIAGQEKSVVVQSLGFAEMISAIKALLWSSRHIHEYAPYSGYLFATGFDHHGTGFIWPDQDIELYFPNLDNGTYVEGKALETAWAAVQSGESVIIWQRVGYYYKLKIPGITCEFSYDGFKEVCTIFEAAQP